MVEDEWGTHGTIPGGPAGEGRAPLRPASWPDQRLIGQLLGDRYEVLEEIGAGAFSLTFRGRDQRLGRVIAIKVLRPTYAIDPAFVLRFEREARAAAAVAHGNVVDIYDVGRQGDLLYLIMQYVPGENLKQLITREGPLPPRRSVELALQILAGLAEIHRAGIIHRDIKPQNILIDRNGVARVADFGIARLTVETGLTTAGTVVGTATYMAPEQAAGGSLVEATDLYAVGVVLYEMLTARLPFTAPTVLALMLQHMHVPPVPPSVHAPAQRIAPALDAVVMRSLAKQPGDRFPDAPSMARALAAVLHLAPDGAQSRTRSHSPVGRSRWFWLIVLLLLLSSGAGVGIYRSLQDERNTPPAGEEPLVAEIVWSPVAPARGSETPADTPMPTDPPAPTPTDPPAPTATNPPTPTDPPTATVRPSPTVSPTEPPTPTAPPVPTAMEPRAADPTVPLQVIVPRIADAVTSEETADTPPTEPIPGIDEGVGDETDAGASSTSTTSVTASDWQGAYFQQTGNLQPWSAVYAQSTGYGVGQVSFLLEGSPVGETFTLSVEGMTSENWFSLPIAILVNGQEVYRGTSPFPTWNGVDGQQPWTVISLELPTSALVPGENTITFVNLVEQGDFSRPPYILLASGTIAVTVRAAE